MKSSILSILILFSGLFLFASCTNSGSSDTANSNGSSESSNNSSIFGSIFSDDISFETIQDPRENAFKINLPKGWQNQIGLVRKGNQTRNHGVSVSPDGKTQLFFGDPNLPYFSLPIAEYGMRPGMQTGDPLLQVANHVPANKFFPDYVSKRYSRYAGFRITGVSQNQNLQQDWEKEMQKGGMQGQISAVDVQFEFQDGNKNKKGKIQGVIVLIQQGWVPSCNGYITEESDMAIAEKCLNEMTNSFKVNEEWQAKENRMVAQRMNEQSQQRRQMQQASFNAHQQRMQNRQASFNAHQNKMKGIYAASDAQFNSYMNQQRVNDQSHQNYMNQQYSNDRSHENYIDYIRDEQRITNGEQYGKVESGYNNYYVNEATGDYFGTNNELDVAPDNYEQWQPEY